MSKFIFPRLWRLIHSEYATVQKLEEYKDVNSQEHKEIRQLIVDNHDEIKDLFIKHLSSR